MTTDRTTDRDRLALLTQALRREIDDAREERAIQIVRAIQRKFEDSSEYADELENITYDALREISDALDTALDRLTDLVDAPSEAPTDHQPAPCKLTFKHTSECPTKGVTPCNKEYGCEWLPTCTDDAHNVPHCPTCRRPMNQASVPYMQVRQGEANETRAWECHRCHNLIWHYTNAPQRIIGAFV